MIRRIALTLCPLALGCMLAATSASARSGIGLPGFAGSGTGSGIGLPGFPGSGLGFPGLPPNSLPALPPGPPSSPGLAASAPDLAGPTPDVAKPYFYQPPHSTLNSVDKQRLAIYHDQLSAPERQLQQRRLSGAVTAQQQRDLPRRSPELRRDAAANAGQAAAGAAAGCWVAADDQAGLTTLRHQRPRKSQPGLLLFFVPLLVAVVRFTSRRRGFFARRDVLVDEGGRQPQQGSREGYRSRTSDEDAGRMGYISL